jgi:hypothetical protein
MQHDTQLRIALTRALAWEHGLPDAAISLAVDADQETVTAQINAQPQDYSYREALEKAFGWVFREARDTVYGYYPVAHLHREDIESEHGRYFASQLAEDDIERIAQDLWTDAFADAYWAAVNDIVADRHPDLVNHPNVRMQVRLEAAIARYGFYDLDDLADAPLFGLLDGLVRAETDGQTLTPPDLAERYIQLLQAENAVPTTTTYDDLVQTLALHRYEYTVLSLIEQAIRDEHPLAVQLAGASHNTYGIQSDIQAQFEAGTPPEAALEDLLRVALERVEAQLAQQRGFEARWRANPIVDVHHELQDPESQDWLTVQIHATASGLALHFPQLKPTATTGEEAEVILGVDYYNGDVHALINNADYPNEPQLVLLGRHKPEGEHHATADP